jgi:ABC-type glycerol-3-phosphate transport system substrate-binding protein
MIPSSLSKGSAGGVSNGLCVPKAISKEKKAMSLEFIKFFVKPESMKKFATIGGQPPARRNVLTPEELKTMERMTVFMEAAKYAVNNVPFALATRFGEYRKAVMEPILSHVLRGVSLDEATKQARSSVEKLLK